MEVVRLEPFPPVARDAPPAVVTIGNFDGVHLGHQALVRAARARSDARHETCLALTFDPHPTAVLHPDRAPLRLMTVAQKGELLAGMGIDVLAVLPFTRDVAGLAPADFAANVLRGALGARAVVVGEGFRFGKARSGDIGDLERLGRDLGFDVVAVAAVLHGGVRVSSTRVRESLLGGDVLGAAALLGRPYFVDGRVVRGDGRGRTLGIPTANLEVENEILPREGVYAARVRLEAGVWHRAVVNRGRRPTFGGGAPTTEAHLLDFEADLYDQRLRVSFVARLRDERAFSGRDALVAQIQADMEAARRVLAGGGDGL